MQAMRFCVCSLLAAFVVAFEPRAITVDVVDVARARANKDERTRSMNMKSFDPRAVTVDAVNDKRTEVAGSELQPLALAHDSKASGVTYGNPKCPCVGFDNVNGVTKVAIDRDTQADYPADLGARCDAWDNDRHPHSCVEEDQKPGAGKGWCAQQWCYVDPCNCDIPVLPKTSAYLPDSTFQGKPVYYSYATCGGEDLWTKENHKDACVNQDSEKTCWALEKCAWDGSKCGGKEVNSQCNKKLHGFTWGMASCRCVGIDNQPGSLDVDIGDGKMVAYPADVGATCQTWDHKRHPECKKPAGERPLWCLDKWCYVDPCSCNHAVPPKTSAYLPDAKYQGKPVYYSYATCGSTDQWTTENHKMSCVNQDSEKACEQLKDKCAWTGKECLGKELVDLCHAPSDRHVERAGAWMAAPMLAFLSMLFPLIA